MKIEPLPLAGCFRITLATRGDARGLFARFYCADTFAAHELNTDWPHCNLSVTETRGTVRGMHFQHSDAAEAKLIRCVRGAAFDVLVDVREGSPTFGQWTGIEITQNAQTMVYAAPGCAHGFQTLKPDTELMYFHSTPYTPDSEGGVHHADPAIGVTWPLEVSSCSDKDAALAPLANIRRFL